MPGWPPVSATSSCRMIPTAFSFLVTLFIWPFAVIWSVLEWLGDTIMGRR